MMTTGPYFCDKIELKTIQMFWISTNSRMGNNDILIQYNITKALEINKQQGYSADIFHGDVHQRNKAYKNIHCISFISSSKTAELGLL